MADIGEGEGMRARCLLNICIPRCRWKNIQVPPPSRWFHLHYALSLLCLCLYFIDRACDIFFLSFLFFSFISSCTSSSLSSLSSSSVLSFHLLWFDVGRGCTYLARNNDSVIGFTPPRISFCAVRPWSFFDKYVPRIIRRFRGKGGIQLRKGMFAFSVSPQFRGIGWPTRFEIKFQFWDFLFSAARWHGERDSIRQDKGRVRFGGKYLKNRGAYIFRDNIISSCVLRDSIYCSIISILSFEI